MNLETAAYFATVRAFVAGGKLNFVSQMQKLSPVEERLDTMVSLSAWTETQDTEALLGDLQKALNLDDDTCTVSVWALTRGLYRHSM